MISIKKICLAVFLACAIPASIVMADDTVKPKDFVEEASAKGLAEIETAKIALEKSQSAEVRNFAQTMIKDHTKANQELTSLAQKKKLDIAKDAELMNQAKAFVLKQRDGESFDQAYANNQVMAHEQAIELFQKAANSQDAELKSFAQQKLPKLQHHLHMAQELQRATGAETDTVKNTGSAETRTGLSNPGERGEGAGIDTNERYTPSDRN